MAHTKILVSLFSSFLPAPDPVARRREQDRIRARRYRARKKAQQQQTAAKPAPCPVVDVPVCPASRLAAWARSTLVIPAGHRNAGQPMELPEYLIDFLRDALQPDIKEAGCYVARKNAKSAGIAALVLAHLAHDGPLRRDGWRCGIASVTKEKATELWQQCMDIGEASGLAGITYGRVPRIVESRHGRVDILSAEKNAGHASGFDLVICDEYGLFPGKARDLIGGLVSSTSARDGRLIAISVLGDAPFPGEMIDRKALPSVVVHVHQAPDDCALDDPEAWRLANPALGTVKSVSYMEAGALRAQATPSEQPNFRAYDLNQPGQISREMICTLSDLQAIERNEAERRRDCFVGFDIGGSSSLTAAALYWPETGRIECLAGCGDIPDLMARGEADGERDGYNLMEQRGELRTWPGRVTPVAEFLNWVMERLEGWPVALAAADRYRAAEAIDGLTRSDAPWPVDWRAAGSGQDGIADVRAFQKAVESGRLSPGKSLALRSAIAASVLKRDSNGNPSIDRVRQRGRIDVLASAVLAVGIGDRSRLEMPKCGYRIIPIDDPERDGVIKSKTGSGTIIYN